MHQCPDEIRTLRDVLNLIRQRPAMYLGEKSLTKLVHFMSGYAMACWVHSIEEEGFAFPHGLDSKFADWLAREKDFGVGASDARLELVLRFGDEEQAFDRFFALWDEFEAT